MFDEQPDGDPHGECAAEIARLTAELKEARQDLRIHEGINVERDARLVQAEERIRYLTMDLEEKARPLDAEMARLNQNLIAANERAIAAEIKESALRAEVERLTAVLSDERIARHALKAGECPPDSVVMLVSSLRRLAALTPAEEPKT